MKKYKAIISKSLDKTTYSKWLYLWKNSEYGNIFNYPAFFKAFLKTYQVKDFLIIAVEKNSKLNAILPLVKEEKYGIKVWSTPGAGLFEKSALLIKNKNITLIKSLYKEIKKLGNVYLPEIDEQDAHILRNFDKNTAQFISSINPYLNLAEDPLKSLSKKQKSKITNRFRKNERHLRFQHYTNSFNNLFEEILRIDKNSAKRKKGYSTFTESKELILFYKELSKKIPQNISIDILYYEHRPIVYGIGFIYKNVYLAAHTAYDAEFKWLTPGKIELYCLLLYLKEKGIEIFDFSRGSGILKDEFTNLRKIQYEIYLSHNLLVMLWWKFAIRISYFLKNTKIIYNLYCKFKILHMKGTSWKNDLYINLIRNRLSKSTFNSVIDQ